VKVADLGDGAECVVFASFVTEPYDIAVQERLGDMYTVNTEDIEIDLRTSKGKVLKSRKKTQPAACWKIYKY